MELLACLVVAWRGTPSSVWMAECVVSTGLWSAAEGVATRAARPPLMTRTGLPRTGRMPPSSFRATATDDERPHRRAALNVLRTGRRPPRGRSVGPSRDSIPQCPTTTTPPRHTNEKPQPPPHSVRSQARGCAYMCGSWMTAVAQDRGALLRYMMTGARAT